MVGSYLVRRASDAPQAPWKCFLDDEPLCPVVDRTRAGECSLDDDDDDGDGDARWEVSLVFSRQRRRSLDVNDDDDDDGEMVNLGPLLKIQELL